MTNCSERLGRLAAGCVGFGFVAVVMAERAGFDKPDPRPYRLGLDELNVRPSWCLFVAGSAYDLIGTAKIGLPTHWHDRNSMVPPEDAPPPLAHEPSLAPLLARA